VDVSGRPSTANAEKSRLTPSRCDASGAPLPGRSIYVQNTTVSGGPVSLLGCASARGWLSLQLFAAAGASREQPARRYDNSPARIRALPVAKAPRSFRPAAVDLDEQLFDQSPRSPAAVGVVGGEASAKECPSAQGDPRRHRNSEAASRRCIPHTARRVSRSNKSGTLPLSPSATALQSPFKQAQCAVCGDGS
jgi:hypothetical protein